MIKANFKLTKEKNNDQTKSPSNIEIPKHDLTRAEFEEYIIKSGASGSFMVFRSQKSEDEMGIEEL